MSNPSVDCQKTRIQVARGVEQLRPWVPEWERLTAEVIEANVFYEPFMMLPAVAELRGGAEVRTLMVQGAEGALLGVFPLRRQPYYSMWKHPYCYLCTPLIRKGSEERVLDAVFQWLRQQGATGALLQFRMHPMEGDFDRILQQYLRTHHQLLYTTLQYERALAQAGKHSGVSPRKKKQLGRLRRRLEQRGALAFHHFRGTEEVEQWIGAFLELEQKGWKGQAGSAMVCEAADRAFLLEMARQGARSGQFQLRAMTLDGRAIAMSITLRSGDSAFAFKIAYDEAFSDCSPGVQLDWEMFQELLGDPSLAQIDSCSDPDYPTLDPIWGERRGIRVATVTRDTVAGRALGEAAVQMQMLRKKAKAGLLLHPELQAGLPLLRRLLLR